MCAELSRVSNGSLKKRRDWKRHGHGIETYFHEERIDFVPCPSRISESGPVIVYALGSTTVIKTIGDTTASKTTTTYSSSVSRV